MWFLGPKEPINETNSRKFVVRNNRRHEKQNRRTFQRSTSLVSLLFTYLFLPPPKLHFVCSKREHIYIFKTIFCFSNRVHFARLLSKCLVLEELIVNLYKMARLDIGCIGVFLDPQETNYWLWTLLPWIGLYVKTRSIVLYFDSSLEEDLHLSQVLEDLRMAPRASPNCKLEVVNYY